MAGFKSIYDGRGTVTGGRGGRGRTDDGRLEVTFTPPPGLGGKDGETGTNPEQLLALAWAACFEGALSGVSGDDVDVSNASIDATVSIGKGKGGMGLAARLEVTLPDQATEEAVDLTRKAHEVCPYSRATRGNIPVVVVANGTTVAEDEG